jgi:histone-lysine N-methyltransferase EZH2
MVPVELAAIQKTKDRHSVIKPDATTVPFYKEIVYLRNNVLAENKRILLYNPYFADDQFKDNTKRTLETELEDVYDMQDDRSLDLLHAEQYRVYGVHINRFIQELGISWDAVLYWFLASEEDIMRRLENFAGNIEPLLSERDLIREYRHKPKWQAVLKLLPDQDCDVLCLSALACKVFSTQQGFSMWQLARQSEIAQTHLRKAIQGSQANPEPKEEATFRAKTCRICYEWNCPFHGEMLGSPYSNSDDNSDDDSSDSSSDSSIDVAINSRRLVCSNGLSRKARLDEQGSYQPPRRKRFDVRRWIERTKTATLEKRRTFYPCNHEGSCKTAQCSCFREDILCEKTCNCHASCQRRYPGCSCKPGMNDNVCAPDDDWCECRQLNRECDADLCANCGATEALNPVNRYTKDKRGGSDRCCNVAIQKGEPVKTYMGNSQTHGWGLYTGVPVKAHDFLGEYHGELVTHDEADRRGTIYAYQKTEYLFNLNGGM